LGGKNSKETCKEGDLEGSGRQGKEAISGAMGYSFTGWGQQLNPSSDIEKAKFVSMSWEIIRNLPQRNKPLQRRGWSI
jgi:hypothetical protein